MASLVLTGDTSGQVTIAAPAVAGTNTATLPAATGTVALTSDIIGFTQTWQSFTVGSQRIAGTTYTNTTGKPIMILAASTNSGAVLAGAQLIVRVNGVILFSVATYAQYSNPGVCFIVPVGLSYSVSITGGALGISTWFELR
jgi:hypothetical protein